MENLNRDLTGTNLEEVVDAYIHALTSRRPRSRYVVGRNGNFYFRPLGVLPDWLSDFLTQGGFPAPDGLWDFELITPVQSRVPDGRETQLAWNYHKQAGFLSLNQRFVNAVLRAWKENIK